VEGGVSVVAHARVVVVERVGRGVVLAPLLSGEHLLVWSVGFWGLGLGVQGLVPRLERVGRGGGIAPLLRREHIRSSSTITNLARAKLTEPGTFWSESGLIHYPGERVEMEQRPGRSTPFQTSCIAMRASSAGSIPPALASARPRGHAHVLRAPAKDAVPRLSGRSVPAGEWGRGKDQRWTDTTPRKAAVVFNLVGRRGCFVWGPPQHRVTD